MGIYVNPENQTKEEWLISHGTEIHDRAVTSKDITKDTLPVCLVDNGPFTAAAVAYSLKEIIAFQNPLDLRPKTWLLVPIEDLLTVTYGLIDALYQTYKEF